MTRMGILGPKGTHSEAAGRYLQHYLQNKSELVLYDDIFDCLRAVELRQIDTAFVPVENSLEGSVNITLDMLAHSDSLRVVRELIWPVHNYLMARPGTKTVRRVFSHPQPISQCWTFLKSNYPQAECVKTASTARAAQLVAGQNPEAGWAAICTRRAGELNGLVTVAAEIQDNMANCTRFFEVQRRSAPVPRDHADKVLIICQIDGSRSGALCEILEEFARRRVNMTRIESRPARTKLGDYIFFFDLDTRTDPQNLQDSIQAVANKCIWLKNLGAFPVYTVTAAEAEEA